MPTDIAPSPPGAKAAVRSVYILDNEPEIATLVATVLGTFGFSARKFTAPAPFFKAFATAVPGLIVLDLALGKSDAVEVLRRLESLKYKGKILLISGDDEATLAQIAASCESHGMTMLAALRKPFRASELKARLAEPSGTRRLATPKPEPLAPPLASATRADSAEKQVVLVVDDDAAVRATVALQLRELGYAVREADGAPAALQIIDRPDKIDLLFTDVVMPGGMNGKQLAVEVRRRRPDLPILFSSGFPGKLRDDGVGLDERDMLLNKPFRRQALAEAVRALLGGHR